MIDKNPYRTLHARMSPPGAAWDEGFAAGQSQAWDSAQVEIDAILASEARPASVGRVVAFLREPRDSTDVNLSLAVAADLIEREFAAGRAAGNARIVAALRTKGTHAADVLADQIEKEAP